jgi:hypothetical protein
VSKVRKYFGITEEEYRQMYNEQGGLCSICGVTLDQHTADVDHCHAYNLVRGLLCRRCNLAIGMFQDDVKLMRRAADYVEMWEDIHIDEPLED